MKYHEAETNFLDRYIVRNRRDRLRMELKSDKHRNNSIWRFAHGARELLRVELTNSVVFTNGALMLDNECLLKKTGNPNVFILQSNSYLDKKHMPFEDALHECMGSGPYILLESDGRFAFVETESDSETHEYIFLSA